MNVYIPASVGEVFDKLSILHLKLLHINDGEKRRLLQAEVQALEHSLGTDLTEAYPSDPDYLKLQEVNAKIFAGIDRSNEWIGKKCFNVWETVKRNEVYESLNVNNNERFLTKKRINDRFDSSIKEVKSHL